MMEATAVLGIVVIDLVLSGDNAFVPAEEWQLVTIGVVGLAHVVHRVASQG
jgi:hypothetical protein